MNTQGTLTYRDGNGQEHRVDCSGGLNSQVDRDHAMRIFGVVNVDGPHVEALREVMDRQTDEPGDPPAVRYEGEVRTEDGEGKESVQDVPLRVQAVTDDGTVRLESDRPQGD